MTHTFHIRDGMTWSDGEPATCEDARWTYQLVLDSLETEYGGLGSYYLEPYLTNAGLESVACEGNSLVATTSFPTTLLTQAYVPILPKHIWSEYTIEQIQNSEAEGFFKNEPPVVGTGPYQAVEWQPGEFIRFVRNESYWGEQGAADEVIIQNFDDASTMVEALKNGEVDYIRGVGADQFDALANEENIETVEGFSNGYTYLSFNTKGNSEGYKGSTSALSDVAFRDALGYALDRDRLVRGDARRARRRWRHEHPAVSRGLARRTDHAAHLRPRGSGTPARCRGLQARCRREASRQGRQADHPAPDVAGLRRGVGHERPVHPGVVRRARDHRRCGRDRGRQAPQRPARPSGRRGRLGLLHVGLGR